jgi:DNA-binding LacI/PurR family transcriptional regulator
LDEFERQGRIKRCPGKGIIKFAGTDISDVVPYIDIIACGLPENVFSHGSSFSELVGHFTSIAAKAHQGIRLHEIGPEEPKTSYDKIVERSDVKACVLLGLRSSGVTELLDEHGVAWVSLFPNTFCGFKRAILPSEEIIALQLEHLFSLGHKRIAYLHSINEKAPSRALMFRREGYYRMMAEKGFRVDPKWVNYTSYNDNDIIKSCERVFSSEEIPTAIVLPDPILPSVYRFLERKNLKVGKDISIIANDDMAVTRSLSPAVTSVHLSVDSLIEKTLELLKKVLVGEDVPDVYHMPVELIVRESTSSIL